MSDMPTLAAPNSHRSHSPSQRSLSGRWSIALHGGAGQISPAINRPPYTAAMQHALALGSSILTSGGSALDAVTATVAALEDHPLFNAGVGSVYTSNGTHELDASVMRGSDRAAGACAGVTTVRNPIKLARAIMEHTPHVMLIGTGADHWAHTHGIDSVPNTHFDVPERLVMLNEWRQKQGLESITQPEKNDSNLALELVDSSEKHGTVGAVAIDQYGHLAAATSTGGTTGKMVGRVGDSPIIGAGCYADDRTAAISSTGLGEAFMRSALAKEISDVLYYNVYRGEPLAVIMQRVMKDSLESLGPEALGGVIVVDRLGNIATSFNTRGMFRAWQTHSDSQPHIAIFEGDELVMSGQ